MILRSLLGRLGIGAPVTSDEARHLRTAIRQHRVDTVRAGRIGAAIACDRSHDQAIAELKAAVADGDNAIAAMFREMEGKP